MAHSPTGSAGRPLEPHEVARYSRHLLLPQVGFEGQGRLLAARVLVVGAGGLGSATLTYLAAAGVGTIGIVDDDVVETSNLQRQVIHADSDVGRRKTESAQESIARLNPHAVVIRHDERLTAANALRIMADYDLVLDGADNFPTRYLVNDACVRLGMPDVWGSIFRFDGQVSVWWPGQGPCYRCVFAEPPPPGSVPSCAEGGVLGVLCATVGAAQATEAVKLILGVGEPLVGRLLVHDALAGSWDVLTLQRNSACAVCSDNPTITELSDDPWATAGSAAGRPVGAGQTAEVGQDGAVAYERINPQGLAALLSGPQVPRLVDVRNPAERAIGTMTGSQHIELGAFRNGTAFADLGDPADPVVLFCRSGMRSAEAAALAAAAGFTAVATLDGGLVAWSRQVDPSIVVA